MQKKLELLLLRHVAAAVVGLLVEPQRLMRLRSFLELKQSNVVMENDAVGTPVRDARRVVEVNGRVREWAMVNTTAAPLKIRAVPRASNVAAVLPTIRSHV